ncbi:MAG TPA: hypothetical protein RMH80_22675, partial [Polyangiaceae bacterium LLY-WYZ-15_(1-7)]|nr:hypothetical protein [Polyangiaceae bacterium LLY-WYZ-15_(1-7)]
MRRLVLLILLAACSGPPEDRATTDVPPPATPTADTPPGPQPEPTEPTERAEQTESPGSEPDAPTDAPDAPADYRLEEWGLVRVFAEGAELATSGVATGERRLDALETTPHVVVDPGLGVRKPILYLSPGERWDPTTPITLRVAFPGLHEAWPAPTSRDDAGFAWTARIDGRCDGARAPDASSPHCASLLREHGGVCEAAEIDHYVRDPRPCIQVGETRTPVLLYNGTLPGSARAILEMDEDGPRVGEHALAHLWWFDGERLHHAADLAPGARPERGERVRAPRRRRSGYGTRDLQPDPNELGLLAGEMRRRVGRALEAMGLESAGDFVRAWEPDVLADPLPWRAFAILDPSAVDALL